MPTPTEPPRRRPSEAEQAMAANAQSRQQQARSSDLAGHEHHAGMMGDGTEEQDLCQPGDPSARITAGEVEEAFANPEDDAFAPQDAEAKQGAENEGMARHRNRRGLADAAPDRQPR